ncbi:hypothetical protein AGMMS49938_00760 [Fibrobacterales bacterium]|nr:hypothetical protein AGMMS49938_00760 [Fibrobacterales bacterium]
MADTNFALGAEITLLGTPLNAVFEKNGDVNKALVLPTDIESQKSVTLDEIVEDFKSAFGWKDGSGITNSLDNVKNINPGELKFQLKSAFLYIETGNTDPNKNVKEYALALRVDTDKALPDLGFFKLNSLSVAVWNTERQPILNQLGFGSIANLLPE